MVHALYADLGRTHYSALLDVRKKLAAMLRENSVPDIVLFAEHHPAVLVGRNVSVHEEKMAALDVAVHKDLGHGGVAYVGPGQLAVSIIHDYTGHVRPHDVASYNNLVDLVVSDVMNDFGVGGKVHVRDVRIAHNVASGGFHINVSAESAKHRVINHAHAVSSMEEALGREPSMDDVKRSILNAVKNRLGYDRIEQCDIVRTEDGISVKKY